MRRDDLGELALRFSEIRARSVSLCAPLAVEDHVVQPVVDVSPPATATRPARGTARATASLVRMWVARGTAISL